MPAKSSNDVKALATVIAVSCCALAPHAAIAAAVDGFAGATAGSVPGSTAVAAFGSGKTLLPSYATTQITSLYGATVPFSAVSFTRIELEVPTSGLLSIALDNLLFPQAAATLSFALVDGDSVLGVINGSGTLQYSVVTSGPKSLFGYAYAVAAPGVNSGAYGLNITHEAAVAPVPLPAAAWLLLSGLGLAGWTGRARRSAELAPS